MSYTLNSLTLDLKSRASPLDMSVPMQCTPKAEYTMNAINYQRRLSAGTLPTPSFASPRSYSSLLLDTLNTLPAAYYQLHSAYRSRDRNDTIPQPVQRHLSEHLTASTALATTTLSAAMNNDPYINEKRKILSRTIISHTDSRAPPPYTFAAEESETTLSIARLQTLPTELLYMIREILQPSDVICLALTSRHLFHLLNYQLIDLRNLLFINPTGHVAQLLITHTLEHKLHSQISAVTNSLLRDRLSNLTLQETNSRGSLGVGLTCSICMTHHPRWYFSPREMSASPRERKCLAAVAEFRLCEHWSEDFVSLRGLRKKEEKNQQQKLLYAVAAAARLYPGASSSSSSELRSVCGHPDHIVSSSSSTASSSSWGGDGFSAPRMRELPGSGGGGGKWIVEKDMMVYRVAERDELTLSLVHDVLKKRSGATICRHVKLGEDCEVVLKGLAKGAKYSRRKVSMGHYSECGGGGGMIYKEVYWPDFESAECEECGTMWKFSIIDTGLWHAGPRYVLKLNVIEPLMIFKNPWEKEWLSKVQGGEGLMRLKWQ